MAVKGDAYQPPPGRQAIMIAYERDGRPATGRDGAAAAGRRPRRVRRALLALGEAGGSGSVESIRSQNPIQNPEDGCPRSTVSELLSEFRRPELLQIVALTLRVTGAALLLAAIVGVPLGAFLGLVRFRGQRLITLALYTGMGLPPVVVGLFVYVFLSRSGPLGVARLAVHAGRDDRRADRHRLSAGRRPDDERRRRRGPRDAPAGVRARARRGGRSRGPSCRRRGSA